MTPLNDNPCADEFAADEITTHRLRLLAAGFVPLPCRGKIPVQTAWQNREPTTADILSWPPDATNTGVNTRTTPAVDIDVLDREVADEIAALLAEIVGHGRYPVRFGEAPKRAMLFRTDTPFKKMQTPVLVDEWGVSHKVEILCDGEQLIVDGVHPDTKWPYTWNGGAPGDLRRDQLPELTADMAKRFIEDCEALMRSKGWKTKKEWHEEERAEEKTEEKTEERSEDAAGCAFDGNTGPRQDEPFMRMRGRAYAEAALHNQARDLANVASGDRNNALNIAALKMGHMIARGWIEQEYVERRLLEACVTNGLIADDGELAARATIKSGIEAGLKDPHPDLGDRQPSGGLGGQQQSTGGQQQSAGGVPPPQAYAMSGKEWLDRDIPSVDFVLGEIFSTETRCLMYAPTGLGKTLLGMALGMAIAGGDSFLHWPGTGKKRRVLFIDGEMSKRLMRDRLRDEAERRGGMPDTFFALSHEDIPDFQPLNTPEGQQQIEHEIKKLGGVEMIDFDNVMSLIGGDQKDEEGWRQTMPWIRKLTGQKIGQIWVHHTGHDEGRSYGTKTREWQQDTVIGLERVKHDHTDVSFRLRFHKARERTPHNRLQFVESHVTLLNNEWASKPAETGRKGRVSPLGAKFFECLVDACSTKQYGCPAASLDEWRAECVKRGVLEPDKPASQRSLFSKYKLELIATNMVACDSRMAWVL